MQHGTDERDEGARVGVQGLRERLSLGAQPRSVYQHPRGGACHENVLQAFPVGGGIQPCETTYRAGDNTAA